MTQALKSISHFVVTFLIVLFFLIFSYYYYITIQPPYCNYTYYNIPELHLKNESTIYELRRLRVGKVCEKYGQKLKVPFHNFNHMVDEKHKLAFCRHCKESSIYLIERTQLIEPGSELYGYYFYRKCVSVCM